ncbi:MAG TPA: FecR family protein [Polyangiaceae bacterium]|nr:FecR family protein [Polyangiaceae bacterium]
MSSPHHASAAARLLRHAPQATPPGKQARERGLSTIQQALVAGQRRQLAWRAGGAVAVAAAVALVAFGLRGGATPSPQLAEASSVSVHALGGSGASVTDSARHRAVLRAGSELSPGSRIETTVDGAAMLRLSTGTELKLDGKSQLVLEDTGKAQRFSLSAGGLAAAVAKLAPGARFVIATPDAEVEVRGTKFQVLVLGQAEACLPGERGTRTRVAVQEGSVEVRWSGQAAQIRSGQHWPEACGASPDADGQSRAPAAPGERKREPRGAAEARAVPGVQAADTSASAAPKIAEASPSSLAAQTQLFAGASKAARRGEVASALAMYQELTTSYPSSALAENAIVERMRLLRVGNPAAARREAERYLARYPGGFGKPEAERIVASP